MLAGTQNVADAFALYFRRLLSFKKLAEAKDRVQRRAQLVTHPRKEFAFSFAGALYLVHQFALGDVFDCPLVVLGRSGCIPDGTGVFANPNFASILAIDLVLKQLHEPLRLDQAVELIAARRIDIDDLADVTHAGDEFLRRVVAINTTRRGIYAEIFSVGSSLENAFDGVFKNRTIFLFCPPQSFFRLLALGNIAHETVMTENFPSRVGPFDHENVFVKRRAVLSHRSRFKFGLAFS